MALEAAETAFKHLVWNVFQHLFGEWQRCWTKYIAFRYYSHGETQIAKRLGYCVTQGLNTCFWAAPLRSGYSSSGDSTIMRHWNHGTGPVSCLVSQSLVQCNLNTPWANNHLIWSLWMKLSQMNSATWVSAVWRWHTLWVSQLLHSLQVYKQRETRVSKILVSPCE